jgi:hypothetical protein
MKPASHVALGLKITLAVFLCTARLIAQPDNLDYADVALSTETQSISPLTSSGVVLMTVGYPLATADFFQYSGRPPVPFAQIQRDVKMSMRAGTDSHLARLAFSGDLSGPDPLAYSSPEPPAPASSSAGFTRTPVVRGSRSFDAKYVWLNGLQFGLAFADIETTQHCVDEHSCREGNPLMPSSPAGKLSVSLGIAAFTAVASYRMKKQRSKGWWIAPAVSVAGHAVGLASGLALR